MQQRLLKFINQTLSVKLSLVVVSAMAILLMASLVVMLCYSRKTIREEALQKATQTLESTVQHIDNILLSVEQTTGNFYNTLYPDIHRPELMDTYCQKLVESNPYIMGCSIAFKPDFFNQGEHFMVSWRREVVDSVSTVDKPVVKIEISSHHPYTEQAWFVEPMTMRKAGWMNTLESTDSDGEPVITFCLPVPGADGQPVAVIAVDVSLGLLSQIVLEAKPSANSYCTILDGDGSFIVHPSGYRQLHQSDDSSPDNADTLLAREAVQAMMSGETGYKPFTLDGTDFYVFYKPFTQSAVPGRSLEKLNWSVGIVYPKNDILGDYVNLLYYVLVIAIVGLLLIFMLCRTIIHRQLKPLTMLTESAQLIAKGNYSEPIPDSRQEDEIGRLQDNFQQMQRSLATHIGQLEQLMTTMQERGERLREAYKEAQKADRIKIALLHNMTDQMTGPADAIDKAVEILCGDPVSHVQQVDDILNNGKTIADVLDNLLIVSDEDMRKEAAHV